jgi:hypothetical protein
MNHLSKRLRRVVCCLFCCCHAVTPCLLLRYTGSVPSLLYLPPPIIMTLSLNNNIASTSNNSLTRPSLNAFFSQSSVACLTHQEECLLKTALAMVVVHKRRRRCRHHEEENSDNEDTTTTATSPPPRKRTLLERMFQSPSSTLLQLPHPQHMDRMFQAARNMALHSNQQQTNTALYGTASHLAHQLQVWMSHDGSDEENNNCTITTTTTTNDAAVKSWIRTSLLAVPSEATFHVYYSLLEHANLELQSLIFKILSTLIHEAYHDKLFCRGRFNNNHHQQQQHANEINAMAVTWLRLAQRCLLTCASPEQLLPTLHENLGELLVPLVSPSSSISNASKNSSFVKTFWDLSCNSVASSSSSSSAMNNTTTALDPGAKMILRLGLYRLLHLQPNQAGGDKEMIC